MKNLLVFLWLFMLINAEDLQVKFLDAVEAEPTSETLIIGLSLIFLAAAFSNAAGIGGGPIIFAILLYVMEMDKTKALGMTQITILGGALVSTMIKMTFKHPRKDAHLIDYDLVAHMGGSIMLGACIGSLLTQKAQIWMILAALGTLLMILSYITITRALILYRQETKAKLINLSQSLLSQIDEDSHSAVFSIVMVIISFGSFVFFALAKGDLSTPSIIDIEFCTDWYFGIFILYLLFLSSLCIITGIKFVKNLGELTEKSEESYWNLKSAFILPVIGLFTGIIAGALAVGGGIILNPVIISYGILPEVSTASCNFFVFLSSFSSALQYYMSGILELYDAALYLIVSMTGSAFGVLVLKKIIDKSGRASIIVFLLGGVLMSIGVLTLVNMAISITNLVQEGNFTFEYRLLC